MIRVNPEQVTHFTFEDDGGLLAYLVSGRSVKLSETDASDFLKSIREKEPTG